MKSRIRRSASSGCSDQKTCPAPSRSWSSAPGIRPASSSALPGAIDPILGPVQHQRRHGDPRESVEGVPASASPPIVAAARARCVGLGGRDATILGHHIGMRLGEAGRVESAPRLALRDGPVDDLDRMRRTGMRPREDQRPDAVGVRERHLLRHHAAERLTVDVCALDAELVEDGEHVLDEGRHRARSGRVVARTVASVIDRDDPELAGERRDAPPPPGDVGTDALEQGEHRGTRTRRRARSGSGSRPAERATASVG